MQHLVGVNKNGDHLAACVGIHVAIDNLPGDGNWSRNWDGIVSMLQGEQALNQYINLRAFLRIE